MPPALWMKLWKADAVPQCCETAWRACLDILPVRSILHRRGVVGNPCCPRCSEVEETVHHALFSCPLVRMIWFASPLNLRFDEEGSVHDFFLSFLATADTNIAGIFLAVLYSVWQARNELLFKWKDSSIDQLLQRASSLRPSRVLLDDGPRAVQVLPSSWSRPLSGVCKMNIDASVTSSKEAGAGMVMRNNHGEVLAAATTELGPVLSPVLAEALGMRWALRLATKLGFRRIWIETDCLELYTFWNRQGGEFSHLATVVFDCRSLLPNFDVFNFTFVRRTSNGAADALARLAFHYGCMIWIEEAPSEITSITQDDVLASMAPS
ncbi:uncharacterized protein LOC130725760 [Lotus japonicus]|uniref:uncharacterized protein LOC130725760 n=1 Tax=Lotus japonicus TaxID=34305 RepID=UPI00258E0E2A|nr:uncharacterized protein LOC130725760 [Lotus japonicus]